MKKTIILLLAATLMMTGCTSSRFSGVATGAGLGGMFGSSIGGLVGGYRGHDVGRVVGMVAGGMVGAAATAERSQQKDNASPDYYYDDGVSYGHNNYPRPNYQSASPWENLEVTEVHYMDSNGNRSLNSGERALIVMEIYNRGNYTLYDIAPQISCDQRRIVISPTAIGSALEPGRGFRYRAEVIASKRLKSGLATFSVAFGNKGNRVTAKTFRIRTER